eukprot:GILI01028561.1.p2 GENE.GILI01028561.1~~GILI01028561.1.p2  ORF type:complete len:158 (+),score=38.62 GILI01028561.1:65-538(+)
MNAQEPLLLISSICVAALPLYMYTTIFDMGLEENGRVFFIGSFVTAFFLIKSYRHSFTIYQIRFLSDRFAIALPLPEEEDDKTKTKKPFIINRRQRMVQLTFWESLSAVLFSVNLLFLCLYALLGWYLFRSWSSYSNYILSVPSSAVVTYLLLSSLT